MLLSNHTHRSCLMASRHGLVVASEVTPADDYGEREAAVWMVRALPGAHQKTLGADKGYDARDFVAVIHFAGDTPHVAQHAGPRRSSAVDGRTTRHLGYAQSFNARTRIEQLFGWIKQAAGLRQLKARGRSQVGAVFRLHVVAYNLIRLVNLLSSREALAWHRGPRLIGVGSIISD